MTTSRTSSNVSVPPKKRDQLDTQPMGQDLEKHNLTSSLHTTGTDDDEDIALDSTSMKVLWDYEPKRAKLDKSADRDRYREDMETVDNVSITPLFSLCSSSMKSSTFSDAHSLQSTRATVLSGRTMETNSSTIAIPPASIMDRTRHSSATIPSNSAITTSSGATTPTHSLAHHHLHHPHISRPNSMRHTPMQRDNSNRTLDSTSTIK